MIVLLLAQVGIVRTPPPPPVYISPMSASQSPSTSDREAAARARVAVGVVVRVPQGVLWSGNLRVDAMRGASWRQTQSEALEPSCEQIGQPFATAEREASVTLRRVSSSQEASDQLSIDLRWTRPSETECGGSKTVESHQIIALAPGATYTLKDDGGLVVELRRR